MFTGIIQNQGIIQKKEPKAGQVRLVIKFKKKEKRKLVLGESIAVDGVCLSVAKITKNGFEADVIKETLQATTLSKVKTKSVVNLERSLRMGDSFGGHFVTGHVDARGVIEKIVKSGQNISYTIKVPQKIQRFIAKKGSIAVDGISLTVQAKKSNLFTVSIIPHTLKVTSLSMKKQKSYVNLEVDLIARYLESFPKVLRDKISKKLKLSDFKKQGF